jgi:hypothetical protein
MAVRQTSASEVGQFGLHGYYPGDIYNGLLTRIVQQAWEMGASELVLIHGHGRNRGITRVSSNEYWRSRIGGAEHTEEFQRSALVDLSLDHLPGRCRLHQCQAQAESGSVAHCIRAVTFGRPESRIRRL